MKLLILLAILVAKGPMPPSYVQDALSVYWIIGLTVKIGKTDEHIKRLVKKFQDDQENGRDRDLTLLFVGSEIEETRRLMFKLRNDLLKRLVKSHLTFP
jgi:hypothetical protein